MEVPAQKALKRSESTSADNTVLTKALPPWCTTEITTKLRLTEIPSLVIALPAQRKVASTRSGDHYRVFVGPFRFLRLI